ncbi:phospholipase D-like domain-containing protein [Bacillus sp. Marseille-Q3570]|uniref:phospholipase D-like domain-containing protein n=1 Tax=Bacillus sp. Marseille-Q3570 TaxID=2963522 RepID=UPI0021B820BB|nr:phospholipase D-like domain-containing protein [Bacillus sp. Marseille-Q3570]
MEWILGLCLVNMLFMLIIAIREVRRPSKALNWLALSLILPFIAFGLYLSSANPLGIRRKRLTSDVNESTNLPDSFNRSASVIADALNQFSIHGLRASRVQILINGIKTYEELIESLKNAQNTIDMEYFIYRDDQIGRKITNVLVEQAKSGVRVRFVRDGLGSWNFPRNQIKRMMEAGIECRTIFPLRFPWILSNWNYRDHCKNVMIDGEKAFTGGINVGYEYTGLKPDVGFWRDTHLRIEGEASEDLQTIFDAHWRIATPGRKKNRGDAKTSPQKVPSVKEAHSNLLTELGAEFDRIDETHRSNESLHKAYVQTLEGNPGIPTTIIRTTYFICLTQANRTIDITTPFFIPEEDILMAIKTAVARGVRVRLLVPRHIENKIVGYAKRTYYGELIEAGVHIYEYNKGMLHAKQMVIDGEVAVVGAANWDMRSFRLNYETCEVIYSADVVEDLTEQFELDLNDSFLLKVDDLVQRSIPQRIIEQGARLFSPLL